MEKPRTWPAAICQDPESHKLWNVRGLDGTAVLRQGVLDRTIAEDVHRAICEHYDWGKEG